MTIQLKHIATVMAGYPLRGSTESVPNGEINFVQMRNVHPDNVIDWASVSKLELTIKNQQSLLTNNDIIFSARGSRNFAYHIVGVPDKTVCAPHFFIVRLSNPKQILPEFLSWQMNQKPAQSYFKSVATGTHILNIRRDVLENLELTIPELEYQKKIIALAAAVKLEQKLSKRLLENREKQIDALALGLSHSNKMHKKDEAIQND